METTLGYIIDNDNNHWVVNCPKCDEELEYTGFFCKEDEYKCKCGCIFKTTELI